MNGEPLETSRPRKHQSETDKPATTKQERAAHSLAKNDLGMHATRGAEVVTDSVFAGGEGFRDGRACENGNRFHIFGRNSLLGECAQ